jgi:hypothetical protein
MSEAVDDRMGKIRQEIDAERARRPNGYATRCECCWFWEIDRHLRDKRDMGEDNEGACHRHAPRIVHHHSAEALGLIAWSIEELANVEHCKDFDYGFESVEGAYSDWPRTSAYDWCGDFQERADV